MPGFIMLRMNVTLWIFLRPKDDSSSTSVPTRCDWLSLIQHISNISESIKLNNCCNLRRVHNCSINVSQPQKNSFMWKKYNITFYTSPRYLHKNTDNILKISTRKCHIFKRTHTHIIKGFFMKNATKNLCLCVIHHNFYYYTSRTHIKI